MARKRLNVFTGAIHHFIPEEPNISLHCVIYETQTFCPLEIKHGSRDGLGGL